MNPVEQYCGALDIVHLRQLRDLAGLGQVTNESPRDAILASAVPQLSTHIICEDSLDLVDGESVGRTVGGGEKVDSAQSVTVHVGF
jgi:hypothetical protein